MADIRKTGGHGQHSNGAKYESAEKKMSEDLNRHIVTAGVQSAII
jgi:hypothetical protein